jgi:hypothetical protein
LTGLWRVAEPRRDVYPFFINLRLPTRDEIHRAFLEGEEAIVEWFAQVGRQVEGLAQPLETQAAALKEGAGALGENAREPQ